MKYVSVTSTSDQPTEKESEVAKRFEDDFNRYLDQITGGKPLSPPMDQVVRYDLDGNLAPLTDTELSALGFPSKSPTEALAESLDQLQWNAEAAVLRKSRRNRKAKP
jgi:hypothetical protein